MERTLILAKPDAYARNLTGEILARFERKGLRPVALRVLTMTRDDGRAPLRRARREAVLRRARRVHHLGAAGRDGARGAVGDRRRAPGDRRDQPARGGAGLDPRRPRARDRREPRARLRRPRVGGARDRDLLPSCDEAAGELIPRDRLVLASRSPQRRAILEALGVQFVVRPSGLRRGERRAAGDGRARERARQGARRARARAGETVLGVDTVVELGGRLYGKPADEDEARATLRALSGATHTVVSGVALRRRRPSALATCATDVTFRELDGATIDWYLATRRVARARRRLRDPGRGLRAGRGDRRRLDQRRRPAGRRRCWRSSRRCCSCATTRSARTIRGNCSR